MEPRAALETDDSDVQAEASGPSQEEAQALEQELEEDLKNAPAEADRFARSSSPLSILVNAMRKYPHIRNRNEFNALYTRYKSAQDEREQKRLKDEIAYRNIGLVIWVAKRYLGQGQTIEDLVQAGLIGLLEGAIPKYEPERGLQFSTYATWWIRHACAREIHDRRTDRPFRVPVHAQERWSMIRRRSAKFALMNQRDPTLEELSALTSIPKDKLEALLISDASFNRRPTSLDAPIGDGHDSLLDILDSNRGNGIETPLDLEWVQEKQREALNALPDYGSMRESIIRHRYGLGVPIQTLQEIGDGYNLSRERIRQLEAEVLGKLVKRLRIEKDMVSALLQLAGDSDIVPIKTRLVLPDMILDETLDEAFEILMEHLKARTEYKQQSVTAAVRTLSHRMEIDTSESKAILEQLALAGRISPVQSDGCVFIGHVEIPSPPPPPQEPEVPNIPPPPPVPPAPRKQIIKKKVVLTVIEEPEPIPRLRSTEHELVLEDGHWNDQQGLLERLRNIDPKLRKLPFSRWLNQNARSRLKVRDERGRERTLFLREEIREMLLRKVMRHLRI